MFGYDYRKRTAVWTNVNVESKMCDKSHLVNNRHLRTAIGILENTTWARGQQVSRLGATAVPGPLVQYLLA